MEAGLFIDWRYALLAGLKPVALLLIENVMCGIGN